MSYTEYFQLMMFLFVAKITNVATSKLWDSFVSPVLSL